MVNKIQLTSDANYSSYLVAFKNHSTFDHFYCALDKNNKPHLCCPGANTNLWKLEENFLGIIMGKTL